MARIGGAMLMVFACVGLGSRFNQSQCEEHLEGYMFYTCQIPVLRLTMP